MKICEVGGNYTESARVSRNLRGSRTLRTTCLRSAVFPHGSRKTTTTTTTTGCRRVVRPAIGIWVFGRGGWNESNWDSKSSATKKNPPETSSRYQEGGRGVGGVEDVSSNATDCQKKRIGK